MTAERRPFTSLMHLENTREYIAWRENKGSPLADLSNTGIKNQKKKITKKVKKRKRKDPGKENIDPSSQQVETETHPDESFTENSLIELNDRRCVKPYASDIYTYLLSLEVFLSVM